MSASLQEIDEFANFAKKKLDTKPDGLSLEECMRLWRAQTGRQESLRGLLQSQQEDEAGLSQPLAEAFGDVRRQLGIVR